MAMTSASDPRPRRALRLAAGTALATAVGFGLALPIPFIAPMLTLFLLARSNRPLPLRAIVGLPVLVAVTTSSGLLIIPLLQYATVSGVLLIGLALFLCFATCCAAATHCWRHLRGRPDDDFRGRHQQLRAGVDGDRSAGQGSARGRADRVSQSLAVSRTAQCCRCAPPPPVETPIDAAWIALRATLVVMPSFLLALIDPSAYMPLI